MIQEVFVGGEPIRFKTLGRSLPKFSKAKKWKFRINMGDFANYGFCPYTAWHLSKGTVPVLAPKVKEAQTAGKIVHDELDKEHEEKVSMLPKATEKTRKNRYKPLEFSRNFPVFLYRKPFLYVGRIDNLCRKTDGNFYVSEDKTTGRAPSRPWRNHLLQVLSYCTGMANTHWRKYDAQYLCWEVRYLDKNSREILSKFGGLYDQLSHDDLLETLTNFESIYQGNDPGFETNPRKCYVCRYTNGCPFK